MTQNKTPHPFLKWAGGKRQLIPQMEEYLPKNYDKFIEPFVGGGAVFFHLLPSKSIISDNNPDLINCYKVIKEDVEALIKSLRKHKYEKNYYYQIRALDRDHSKFAELSDVEKASRSIYLNKTGYNGLYRVNSKGFFNVPFGRHKNPKICDDVNLRNVSRALRNVEIYLGSFEICLDFAKQDDFVYLDPPYHPLSDTALFTSYTKSSFDKSSQKILFEVFKELDKKGCYIMLSNSYSKFILDLYKDYKIVILKAKRNINSNSLKRGLINEVLILNTEI
ncbi:MAG: DNA adenine methylase [Candidatus Hermodarchaeota archaeon]